MGKTFNPCDECDYSFSKQNQESGMCKICEFEMALRDVKTLSGMYERLNSQEVSEYHRLKEYEEKKAECCSSGFHACEYPLDVLNFGASINLAGLVKAAIEYTKARVDKTKESDEDYGASSATDYCGASSATGDYGASSATGDYGASSATGDYGASSATGDYGASSATGDRGASSATGDRGASSETGDRGASSATGDRGASSATGNRGASSATGDGGASSATGDYGASSATGDYGESSATGYCGASSATGYKCRAIAGHEDAVAVAWGYKGIAKGVLGAHIVLADWEGDENEYRNPEKWTLKGAKMKKVDGKTIKPDVWYTIRDGKVIEADMEEYDDCWIDWE